MKNTIIIVALCNGPDLYNWTRHNVAKNFLLTLSSLSSFTCHPLYYAREEIIDGKTILYIIPRLYMNTVGEILSSAELKYIYKNNLVETIIIHDDLEVPFGKYLFRKSPERGERGHNGIRSYTKVLKSIVAEYQKPFYLSIGIGRPAGLHIGIDKWVLEKFSRSEQEKLLSLFPLINEMLFEEIALLS